jgi:hypothetical protein
MAFKIIIRSLFILLISLLLGVGIGVYRIASIRSSAAFKTYGSWRGTTDLPLNRDNLVTTQVTIFALFALPSEEAVYLFAADDNEGKRLNGSNNYEIKGNINDIKAEYWSITAYASDLYLIPNEANRYSFNRDNLQTDNAGNFTIHLSAAKSEGNWLPLKTGGKFQLVLRIYKGEKEFMEGLGKANLPLLRKQ